MYSVAQVYLLSVRDAEEAYLSGSENESDWFRDPASITGRSAQPNVNTYAWEASLVVGKNQHYSANIVQHSD